MPASRAERLAAGGRHGHDGEKHEISPWTDRRHSYATWLVDDGVPPNMVQRVMGHEGASTTLDLYTRRTADTDRILAALSDEDDAGRGACCCIPAVSIFARHDEGPGPRLS